MQSVVVRIHHNIIEANFRELRHEEEIQRRKTEYISNAAPPIELFSTQIVL